MPAGNLLPANPTGVFPQMTYISFDEGRIYPGLFQNLHDGTPLASLITDGLNTAESIRTYTLQARLTASALGALRTFFEGKDGPYLPFLWYHPYEQTAGAHPGSNYDGTGASTQGRHTVMFLNPEWVENITLGRSNSPFTLFEIA